MNLKVKTINIFKIVRIIKINYMEKIILISLLIYWILSAIITFVGHKWKDYKYRKYYREKYSLYELISYNFLNIFIMSVLLGWGILPIYLILRVIDYFSK